jgi:hypothetical protein
LIGGVAAYFLYHFLRHPLTTGDPKELKELPIIGGKVAETLTAPVIGEAKAEKSEMEPSETTH